MIRSKFRLLNWLMIAALTLTIAPVFPDTTANAAPAPSVYFQFRDFSIDSSFPTDVNSNLVNIVGTFSNVTASTISYKIEQITITGPAPGTINVVQSTNGSTQPVLSGQNFTFAGVTLYSGLNRITVTGVNSSGNTVSGVAFVNFSNVPAITEIKLSDGRDILSMATQPVTTNANEALTVKAPNATGVSVNGVEMFGGANSSFILSNLGLVRGKNKLTIIARNANKTYEVTRYLVYFDGNMTAYDVKIGNVLVDGNAQIAQDVTANGPLTGAITAQLIVPNSASPLSNNSVTFDVYNSSGSYSYTSSSTTVSAPAAGANYTIYSITQTGANPSISATGTYTIRARDTVNNANFSTGFSFRNTSAPYINDIKQAYGVSISGAAGSPLTFTSYSSFPDNTIVSQVPLTLFLDTTNFDASATPANTTTVKITQNGVVLTNGVEYIATTYTTGTGNKWPAIQFTKLPSGTFNLDITIQAGGNSDTITRSINFFPVASIQVDSIYDGKTFNNDFTSADVFTGKLINFNLNSHAELDTLMLNFNGTDYPLVPANSGSITPAQRLTANGGFAFDPTNPPVGGAANRLHLVLGPNTLIFKGVSNGIPVTTTLTVYYFPSNNPSVSNVRPVPFSSDPTLRVFNDANAKFVNTGTKKYTTSETKMDLMFDVANITNATVQIDGISVADITVNGTNLQTNDLKPTDTIGLFFEDGSPNLKQSLPTGAASYTLRLTGVPLPKSGDTNFTITIQAGGAQIIENVTVTRELSPYIVLSPRLPEESVINSNFLNVSIKAEGADQILIGKVAMNKGQGDIFRYEVKNLKSGSNTISFTVFQGNRKINGKFTVNYAADNSLNAQYKAPIGKSGKLSMFKGDLAVSFPKNTFLRQANVNPGQDVQTVDLFDGQELYFGIADRTDGRTQKKYNAVGELDPYNNYMDGTIVNVPVNSIAVDRLRPQPNFAYSSNLYWIDAGYYKPPVPPSSTFTLVNAMSPYATGSDVFYLRALDPNKWLEPSQRGTITIRYDSDVRDALAPNLSIWRYTGTGWQNIGGVVNTKNKTVTAPLDGFGYYAVMSLRYSFGDVQSHSYARNAMEAMFAHGIMTNKDNNSFGAFDNITRGEFAQMLVKILGIPLDYNPANMTFDDVLPIDYPNALWNYRYVETAVKKGFIRGKAPRLFFPNDPLTREEAAIMIARAFNLVKSNADPDKDKASLQKQFTDGGTIDYYASSSILAVVKAKYITGIPNTDPPKTNRFEAGSYLKRADAAVIATKIMKALKKL